jgi:hypothetical protein
MVTFEQARVIVQRALRPGWPADGGTLVTMPYGWEDAQSWQVVAGAAEALIDGDIEFEVMDPPAYLVDKATGRLEMPNQIEVMDRLDDMTPVGTPPA